MKIIDELMNWQGEVEINGVLYDNITEAKNSISNTAITINDIVLHNTIKSVSKRKIVRCDSVVDTNSVEYLDEIDREEFC